MDQNNPQDRKALAQAYGALCLAWGREADAHQLKVYEAALRAVPVDLITEAAGLLVRDATLRGMPSPGQWLAAAEDAAAARAAKQKRLPAAAGPMEAPYCPRCEDRGWAYKRPDGTGYDTPPALGGPDTIAFPCPCRETNPRWRRRHRPERPPKFTSRRKPAPTTERLWYRDDD